MDLSREMKKNSKNPRLARASKTERRVMTELFETAKKILYGKSTAS